MTSIFFHTSSCQELPCQKQWLADTVVLKSGRQNGNDKYTPCSLFEKSFRCDGCQPVEPDAVEYWIDPTFVLWWVSAVFILGQEIDTNIFVGAGDFIIYTGSILIGRVFVAHFVVCVLACTVQMCDKTYMEKDCTCASIRQACLKARGFTTQPYTCITHLAEGYTSRFKVSLNISLSQMQLQKPQNTPIMVRTDCFSMPCEVRPINWENEHDWGLSTWAGKGQSRW